ncbi:MAG: C1 family peptidase, partial [Chloroflexi bacterium]|nr:C1 family peptidase [Chloroflexota bacterium]
MKNRLGIAVKLATSLVLICAILVTSLYDAEGLWAAHQEPTPQYQARESDHQEEYPLMKPSREKRREWIEKYNKAPKAHIDEQVKRKLALAPTGSLSLLSHLQYTPSERNQGSCGNCWAWAGTGVMEIALSVQRSIKDRLSIQYLNSNFNGGSGVDWACCGGWLSDIASFYSSTGKAIPWSNTNASWQDGSRGCGSSTSVPGANISTTPYYPITSIATQTITTHGVTQNTAIANIKNVLNQNKAVWFAYFLPTTADWSNFSTFWSTQSESTIWDPDFSCGHAWDAGGAGHAVLCVGYNDDDPNNRYWIMVNSWGTAGGNRLNGIFRLAMDMNYGCQDGDRDYMFYWQTLDITYGQTSQPSQKLIGADEAASWNNALSPNYICFSRFQAEQTGNMTTFKIRTSTSGNVKVAL